MSVYGPIHISGTSQAQLGDVHHHHYSSQAESQWQECVRHLLLVDPRESKDMLKARKGARVHGTCEWFLSRSELESWQRSSSPRTSIFWLYGHPGTGKSTLTIHLVEALEEQFRHGNHPLLAYFFCDNTSKDQNTATAVLRGLLYQLCMLRPVVLAQILLPEYGAKGVKLFDSFQSLWHVFDTVVNTITDEVVIIIDALDECDQTSQHLLLQKFEHHCSRVRFFITSRPYPAIREVLEDYVAKDLSSFTQIEADINLFISDKVSKLALRKKYTPRLRKEVTDLLTSRAEGTFLWIGLACAEMQRLSARAGLDLLKCLPSGLNFIYQRLFERAITDSIEAQERTEDITNILKFVAVAIVPMTVGQLSSACKLYQDEPERERDLFTREKIEACRFMVVVDDKYVRLLHKSVKDFLFGSITDHFPSLLIAHADLAHRCVAHLIESFRKIQTPIFSTSYDEFYKYSARNWVHHARYAQQEYRIRLDQESFFQHRSECRDDWLSYLLATEEEEISFRFSLFDVAAKWGINSLLEYAISTVPQSGISLRQFENDVENAYSNPLLSAASCSEPQIFTRLLNLRAIEIDSKLYLVDRLDSRIGDTDTYKLPVSGEVVVAVCRNTHIGGELVMSVISERSSKIVLNGAVLKAIFSNESSGLQMLQMLLKDSSQKVILTTDLIDWAMKQGPRIHAVLDLLQRHSFGDIEIDDELLESVVRSFSDEHVRKTLKYYRRPVLLSKDLLIAAIQNRKYSKENLLVLIKHTDRSVRISVESLRLVAEFYDFQAFAETAKLAEQITLDSILADAAANQRHGDEIVAGILREEPQCSISEVTLLAAAQNRPMGGKILHLLFAHSSVTEATASIIAAAMDVNYSARPIRAFWTPDEPSRVAGDIEDRISILLDHINASQILPDGILDLLIYDDANQGRRVLYSSALDVIDILQRKFSPTFSDSVLHQPQSIYIADEILIALLERKLVPNNEALLQLVVRQYGNKAVNYVLDRSANIGDPEELIRAAVFACNELAIEGLLSRYPDFPLKAECCKDTGWGLYHIRYTYHSMSPREKDLMLYSTVLHSDDHQYLQSLLDLGADPNYRHDGCLVLEIAIDQKHLKCVETLFLKGANIDLLPERGGTILRQWIRAGNLAVTQLLIEHGANVNPEGTHDETPLVVAINQGHEAIATILIQAGADVNATSTGVYHCALDALARGWSWADRSAHARILQRLLEAGANLSPKTYVNLMQRAVRDSNGEAIWILARKISWFGFDKQTSELIGLDEAKYSLTLICLLLRLGADLSLSTYWREPILQRAVREGHRDIMSWLLRVFRDVLRPREPFGEHGTQDHIADEEYFWIHPQRKVDLETRNGDSETLLHLAAIEGRSEVIQWLLDTCTCDDEVLDAQDRHGRTALHKALQFNHYDVVEILLEYKVSIELPDTTGYTARDWMAAFPELRPLNVSACDRDDHVVFEIRQLRKLQSKIEAEKARFGFEGTISTYYLARLLYDLGFHVEALRACEENIQHGSGPPKHLGIICNCCEYSPIVGQRYICYVCDNCDFCESCWEQRELEIHSCCIEHESALVPVPRANWKEEALREPTKQWLDRLIQVCWTKKTANALSVVIENRKRIQQWWQ